MTVLRACVKCGARSRESYCAEHKPRPWAASKRRGTAMGLSGGAWETDARVLDRDQGCCYLFDRLTPHRSTISSRLRMAGPVAWTTSQAATPSVIDASTASLNGRPSGWRWPYAY